MLWRGLTSFLMSPYTMHGSQAGTTRARTLGFSYTILDRIAEVVKYFPCLYFHVRLVFRHRHVYVPSLTDALSIFSKPKWWGSEILLCPLSIVSPIVVLHLVANKTRAQMRPAGTVFFTHTTNACTKYFGRHL